MLHHACTMFLPQAAFSKYLTSYLGSYPGTTTTAKTHAAMHHACLPLILAVQDPFDHLQLLQSV